MPRSGGKNAPPLSDNADIDALLRKVVRGVKGFAEEQIGHIEELVNIGIALSAEKDLDRLLEMIVTEAMRFANADGGALYIRDEGGGNLQFTIVKNKSLQLHLVGSGETVDWSPVPLYTEDGRENHHNVSAHCALTGKAVNIPDVYDAQGFDFSGTREFDRRTGYRSRSMLVLPLRDHEDEVIGVLQLLNAKDRRRNKVVVFPEEEVSISTALASLAATAITNVRLIDDLENLLHAFVRSIATAIDEKSPYTKGHIERVAGLAERIAQAVNDERRGVFAGARLDADELAELRLAAWLHDVGKICTPEWVLDKRVKLEAVVDRLELIRCRLEIRRQQGEIERLRLRLGEGAQPQGEENVGEAEVESWFGLLERLNSGEAQVDDGLLNRVGKISEKLYCLDGEEFPLITEDELKNLSIRSGTLNDEERRLINNHVAVTIRMLENLPFPRKFRNVPRIAGLHHERLNGKGYPAGLSAKDIPLVARILAVADTFEALTASDRPYKPGKLLSQSMRVLEEMAGDGHLDGGLCDLLVRQGVFQAYARACLPASQVDGFVWRGKEFAAGEG